MGSKISMVLVWFPLTLGLLFSNLLVLSSMSARSSSQAYEKTRIYRVPIASSALDGSEQVLGATIEAGMPEPSFSQHTLPNKNLPLPNLPTIL